ncbi:MAG: hypothetical protein N3F07_02255 [Candidatus Micrarchaeota archaeon]|nr:hypothetical protein [Candidatus Micrarchaeota archaeon]
MKKQSYSKSHKEDSSSKSKNASKEFFEKHLEEGKSSKKKSAKGIAEAAGKSAKDEKKSKKASKEFFEKHLDEEKAKKASAKSKKKEIAAEEISGMANAKESSKSSVEEAAAVHAEKAGMWQKTKELAGKIFGKEGREVAVKSAIAAGATGLAAVTAVPVISKMAQGQSFGSALAETAKSFWGGVTDVMGAASNLSIPILAAYLGWKFYDDAVPVIKNQELKAGSKIAKVAKIMAWPLAKAYLAYHLIFRFAEEVGIWGMGILDAAKIAISNTLFRVNELTAGLVVAHPYIFIPGFALWKAKDAIKNVFQKFRSGEKVAAKDFLSAAWETAKWLIPGYAIYRLVAEPLNSWIGHGNNIATVVSQTASNAWNDFVAVAGWLVNLVAANPLVAMAMAAAAVAATSIIRNIIKKKGESSHHH